MFITQYFDILGNTGDSRRDLACDATSLERLYEEDEGYPYLKIAIILALALVIVAVVYFLAQKCAKKRSYKVQVDI